MQEGLDGGGGAAGLLSSSLQGMTTVTAFNMQDKLAEDYKQASEVMRRETWKCHKQRLCMKLSVSSRRREINWRSVAEVTI